MIQKEQASQKKMEAKAVNICQSRPSPEYAEDSEEDETLFQTCKVEYEQGDRLFVMRILSKPATEELRATSTISQKLAEGARRASKTQKGLFTLPDCAKGFESVFAKEDFNILLEDRQWDHAVTPLENFLWKCNMGYTLYPWISLLKSTLEISYKSQT